MKTDTIVPTVTLVEDEYGVSTPDDAFNIQPVEIHIDGVPNTTAEMTRLNKLMQRLQRFFSFGDPISKRKLCQNHAEGNPIPHARLPFSFYSRIVDGSIVYTILPNFAARTQIQAACEYNPDAEYASKHEENFAKCGYRFMQPEETEREYRKLYRICEQYLRCHVAQDDAPHHS